MNLLLFIPMHEQKRCLGAGEFITTTEKRHIICRRSNYSLMKFIFDMWNFTAWKHGYLY